MGIPFSIDDIHFLDGKLGASDCVLVDNKICLARVCSSMGYITITVGTDIYFLILTSTQTHANLHTYSNSICMYKLVCVFLKCQIINVSRNSDWHIIQPIELQPWYSLWFLQHLLIKKKICNHLHLHFAIYKLVRISSLSSFTLCESHKKSTLASNESGNI